MPHRRRPAGFSLIELLTVIAIMSILMGIVVSSVSLPNSVGLTAEGNNVATAVSFARQNSISQDAFTAIVILTQGPVAYSAYCLMQLPRDPVSGNFTDSTWQQTTPWRFLRTGVVFDPSASVAGGANFFAASGSLMCASANLSYHGQPVDLSNGAVFQVFRPDGTMTLTQPLRLRMVRGTWNAAQNSVSYQGNVNGSNPANYYDVLFLEGSGQTKIIRPN